MSKPEEPALMISFGAVHVLIHLFLLSDFVKIAMTSIGASNMTTMLISFAWAIYAAGSIIIGTIRKKVSSYPRYRLLGTEEGAWSCSQLSVYA